MALSSLPSRLPPARMSPLSFALKDATTQAQFSPRLGTLTLRRDGTSHPQIETPAMITATSRGIVPHLSKDHTSLTRAIAWTQVHFESFLEQSPPLPTLQEGSNPLHAFLGFSPERHILSLSARDPHDGREIPPNGKDYISASCVRGVRKLSAPAWRSYVMKCKPDVVTALSDVPFTRPPHSQKRTTKSLEKSTAWLADLLRSDDLEFGSRPHNLSVLVHMVGGTEERARRAFSECLVESLHGKDLELIHPLKTLDEGLCGYVFDFVPLQANLEAESDSERTSLDSALQIQRLLHASLQPLPTNKLRIVHSSRSPHEILSLINKVGIDLFDARWAQDAADMGVALDFCFPVPEGDDHEHSCRPPPTCANGKLELGHNLFDSQYAHDHSRLAFTFLDSSSASTSTSSTLSTCSCAACSPLPPSSHVVHSSMDSQPDFDRPLQVPLPPYTRAYIHHLLHTHEMSSHALLAMHNLTVIDAFFAGIRKVLNKPDGNEAFAAETGRFNATYDEELTVLKDARMDWARVDRERGKGRLTRERAEGSS